MRVSNTTDQDYLLSEQYRDTSNLDARIQLHRHFSTNKYGWNRWVFDQLDFPPASRILELGCGPGNLWIENMSRIPQGWDVILSDLSPGMVEDAKRGLPDSDRRFEHHVIDAQEIPFESGRFDGVIANHMLYHVPDVEKALSEICRVMRDGGHFYATTVGRAHMEELNELVSRFAGDDELWSGALPESFLIENGAERLERWFSHVVMRRYVDQLIITEADPLIAYVRSTAVGESVLKGDRAQAFKRFVESEMASRGTIVVNKDTGIFEALRPAG